MPVTTIPVGAPMAIEHRTITTADKCMIDGVRVPAGSRVTVRFVGAAGSANWSSTLARIPPRLRCQPVGALLDGWRAADCGWVAGWRPSVPAFPPCRPGLGWRSTSRERAEALSRTAIAIERADAELGTWGPLPAVKWEPVLDDADERYRRNIAAAHRVSRAMAASRNQWLDQLLNQPLAFPNTRFGK